MKHLLMSLVLGLAIALSTFAQETPLKYLGGGFMSKDRVVADQVVKLVKFPLRCTVRGPSDYPKFAKCLDQSLPRIFPRRKATLGKLPDGRNVVKVGQDVYEVGPLGDQFGDQVLLVGISLRKLGQPVDNSRYF